MERAEPSARAIAWTRFDAVAAWTLAEGWTTDPDTDPTSGAALVEFAGRACYQSWKKPNPATATNTGYIAHLLDVGHLSVLEHGTVTMYLTGVSRSFTHELVRHRHFSYSQLSQRYVPGRTAPMVEPAAIAEDPALHKVFTEAADAALRAYGELLDGLEAKLAGVAVASPHRPRFAASDSYPTGSVVRAVAECVSCAQPWPCPAVPSQTQQRKVARQAARSVLPNAAETRIVVTGNYRAWRHLVDLRATEHADVEIRAVAVACLRELQRVAPNVFADYTVTTLDDGTEAAATSHAERS